GHRGRRRRPPAVGMAARILHRLRHALGAEGAREERAHDGGEAEDCPESSELEDDTEGLSTRLSGTLSFASHEDEDGQVPGRGAPGRFGCDMAGIAFPRKRLRRNFTAETIAKRSRAFEQFLSHLHSIRLTCTGMYREALATWANACRLQERLGVCGSGRFLLTLAGLAVCHQELDQLGEAHGCCEQALQLLEAQDSHPLLGPFLQAHVHLAWKVGKDKRRSEARLQGLQEAGLPLQQQPSLKECLIKEPLE
uniref:Sorting nexin family member 21 n=1 Tax=Anas platyrhynchos TaxID=8839 RepID=A0A8B9STJ9_ANAPL